MLQSMLHKSQCLGGHQLTIASILIIVAWALAEARAGGRRNLGPLSSPIQSSTRVYKDAGSISRMATKF